jgi:hypothetical protein
MMTMEPQCLATLQTLLTDVGPGTIEQPLLEQFYKHCVRQPVALQQRLANRPLKTLLYHYCFLRPVLQTALAEFVAFQWQTFSAGVVVSDMIDDPSQAVADPVIPNHELSSIETQFVPQARRDDWFDLILDGIRILLFR